MTVLIIGGASYTGYNFALKICKKETTYSLITNQSTASRVIEDLQANGVKIIDKFDPIIEGDVQNLNKVFYFGGYSCSDHKFKDLDGLVRAYSLGILQALEIGRIFNCKVFICGSYWEIVETNITGLSINLYAALQQSSNLLIDFYKKTFNTKVTKIYLADTYGPSDWRPKLLSNLISPNASTHELSMGSGKQVIGPMYIDDVTDQLEEIAYCDKEIDGIQLIPIKIYTLEEYLREIEDLLDTKLKIKWGSRISERQEINVFPQLKAGTLMSKSKTTLKEGINFILG